MSYQEYEKDRIVQHTNRKATLPNIAPPSKMNKSEAEFSDYTSPIEMEEVVNDRKDNKNKKYDRDKEPEFPDDTSTVDMEEDIINKNMK